MRRNGLLKVRAARPPEIVELGASSDWKFETTALAADFARFEIRALASSTPTISIFDYIGDDGDGGGVSAKRIGAALRQIGDKPIIVEINSPGGNYFEGVAIYNLLRRHTQPISVQVLGIAASAASVIAMAGDEIAIAHNAEIMIHEARGLFFGTKSEMKDGFETLGRIDDAMTSTYAARSGRDKAEFDAMIAGKDVFFRGQEAIDVGLADTLMEREAQMPVYAAADQFPNDKASLDRFLAKQDMPRAARRDLYRAIGTQNAADLATPSAGNEPQADYSRLLAPLTVKR
ncbi:head maturation protease, ClpP-related [Croceicoccus sp. BE223]|uniref:head maturation protease, ClpP-related n=1 Tax=Croceicoccus sp. BE223 TaxID=2817716 RepID=UPI002861F9A2|nr:head maturation protease, ClpP-related [Croceicoccus sp. BE223]MDR7102985.1 ATP-dependent protease ClpP protease subunit [Croceicoccus sp. BE223]